MRGGVLIGNRWVGPRVQPFRTKTSSELNGLCGACGPLWASDEWLALVGGWFPARRRSHRPKWLGLAGTGRRGPEATKTGAGTLQVGSAWAWWEWRVGGARSASHYGIRLRPCTRSFGSARSRFSGPAVPSASGWPYPRPKGINHGSKNAFPTAESPRLWSLARPSEWPQQGWETPHWVTVCPLHWPKSKA